MKDVLCDISDRTLSPVKTRGVAEGQEITVEMIVFNGPKRMMERPIELVLDRVSAGRLISLLELALAD